MWMKYTDGLGEGGYAKHSDATHCSNILHNILQQHNATLCDTLQHNAATHCNTRILWTRRRNASAATHYFFFLM